MGEIQKQKRYDIPIGYKKLGEALRQYRVESGDNLLENDDAVQAFLEAQDVSVALRLQLAVFLECSSIRKFIPQLEDGVSIVSVNTVIINAERTTGLQRDTIKNLIASVITMTGLNAEISMFPYLGSSGTVEPPKEKAIVFSDAYQKKLIKFQTAVEEKNTDTILQMLPDVRQLAEAGVPLALYCMGQLYEIGLADFPQDPEKALKFYSAAADGGCAEANASLGDTAYKYENYSRAYEYYTSPGAVALNKERQGKLENILNRKPLNRRFLVFLSLFVCFCIAVNVLAAVGVFSSFTVSGVVLCVISSLLCLAGYVFCWLLHFMGKYDVFAWAPSVIGAVFFLFLIFII